ncbi:MAG: protein translocase subunit SecD [Aquihabitans sp.]
MTRRRLLIPMIAMIVAAIGGVLLAVSTNSSPVLGLDLQGGFSVVLQAKEVNGRLPSEESVDKAKDIIRQRVDGLGVAEPDITRQGHTVVVQLPGVKNRSKAESLVGCTARLEFRPVLSTAPNPNAPKPAAVPGTTGSSTTKPKGTTTSAPGTTTTAPGASTTTAPGASTTAAPGTDETGMGAADRGTVGVAIGDGALPVQFAPTTTTTAPPTTTTAPTTTTTTAPPTTTSTTVVADGTTTTVPAGSSTSACGGSGVTTDSGPGTTVPGTPAGGVTLPSDDGLALYTMGPVGMKGDALKSSQASLNNGQWEVLTSVKGSEQKSANVVFNACYNGQPTCPAASADGRGLIAIVLDGKVLSAPAVNGPNLASSENFSITGGFSQTEAKDLALVLRYGSLPVEFEQAALQQVSATLGQDSLRAGLLAGLLGVLALAVYMVVYYRGFGLIVVVSLAVWASLMYGLVCLLSATQGLALTLAGITGIIVSVGTTVDTYIVIFERVKDEVRNGRTIRRASEIGYESGINTAYTANGAAFIGAFLLWYLTVGPVRGFAYFLGISIILDLTVAVLFTRPLLLLLSRSPRFAKARFFGVGSSTDQTAIAPKVAAS